MITFKDVTLPTKSGQYWAELNPLCLLKVLYGGEVTSFKLWQSGFEAEQDISIVCPLNDNFRLLRFSYPYSNEEISEDLGIEFKVRTGDIFEIRDRMLAFAVVEDGGVTLYTDERVSCCNGSLIDSLVLRGPGPELTPPVLTRYERIINASKTNFSMVRPVGRVLLRSKGQDPLLLPTPHIGSEVRVFTNQGIVKGVKIPDPIEPSKIPEVEEVVKF